MIRPTEANHRETAERPEGVVVVAARDDGDRDAPGFAAWTARLRGTVIPRA